MSYDLCHREGSFRLNIWLYPKVLNLALAFDWIPKGTTAEYMEKPIESWDGSYYGNNMQYVTSEDAHNLAEALERALENVPDIETTAEPPRTAPQEIVKGAENIELNFLKTPQNKKGKEFIKNTFETALKNHIANFRIGLHIPEREERSKLLYSFADRETIEYMRDLIAFLKKDEGFVIM